MAIIEINNIEFNSYATVEDATVYFAAKYGSNWQSVENKEQLLVTATRIMENIEFMGKKVDETQDLQFPRVICEQTIAVDDKNLIACCCEIANAIYNTNTSNLITPNAEKIKTMSVGDTSITYKDGATIETDIFKAVGLPIIKKYLGNILKGSIRIIL